MNPITKQRLLQFKNNKRSYYSFWILLFITIISFGAELFVNDKPLLVYYKGNFYYPIIKSYSETTFDGEFETEANYRDKTVIENISKNGWMIFPIVPFGPQTVNYDLSSPVPSPPSKDNFLGTDDQGRDVLARLIYGIRISLLFGFLLTIFTSVIGVFIGSIQGYFGGKIDLCGQRILEIWGGLPVLYLLIILSSIVEPSFFWLLGTNILFGWTILVNIVRAEFFKTRSFEYIKAAEALGVPSYRIIWRHMLPNAMVATITYIPFIINTSITTLTSLDFLGFGLPPGSSSIGELITQGKNNIQSPWLGLTAFFSLGILLSLLIFIGEGVRDAFDPRKKN